MINQFTDSCCVCASLCLAPAGILNELGVLYEFDYSNGGGANCTCFACGQAVCQNCSRIVNYYDYGFKRICYDCMKENDIKPKFYEYYS